MKQSTIAEILRHIRPLARQHKIFHLRGLISVEKPRSYRRRELEAALAGLLLTQLRKEIRGAA